MYTLPHSARYNWTLQDVLEFADAAHANVINKDGSIGQERKYTGEPYIVHPMAVAGIVAAVPGATLEMIAACYLHDVVEDTSCDLGEIRNLFGQEVARIVDGLSDMSTPADGNRKARKAAECVRLASFDWAIQTCKLGDLISNTLSITALDPKFSMTYLSEKQKLLEVLTKGDQRLHLWATRLCAQGQDELLQKHLSKMAENSHATRKALREQL